MGSSGSRQRQLQQSYTGHAAGQQGPLQQQPQQPTAAGSDAKQRSKNLLAKAFRAVKLPARKSAADSQPPPLPPRPGRMASNMPRSNSTLGFIPEPAFSLGSSYPAGPTSGSGGHCGSSNRGLTLPEMSAAASSGSSETQRGSGPVIAGGRGLSQSCSNLVYGAGNNLYPKLRGLDEIEQESSGSSSSDNGGHINAERLNRSEEFAATAASSRSQPGVDGLPSTQQAIYSEPQPHLGHTELPKIDNTGETGAADEDVSHYAELGELDLVNIRKGATATDDPVYDRLDKAVRRALTSRTIERRHTVGRPMASAPSLPNDYEVGSSAASQNRLAEHFIQSNMEKRQMLDDLILRLTQFISSPRASTTASIPSANHEQLSRIALVQQTLKELYYLHSALHGHIAEEMSVDLLPDLGQKEYSFWESLHRVILRHHDELDQADAACAAELLRSRNATHAMSVLEEYFKMQRFLLLRQRDQRNAELASVRRSVGSNPSWAASATAEAPAAAAAAGLQVRPPAPTSPTASAPATAAVPKHKQPPLPALPTPEVACATAAAATRLASAAPMVTAVHSNEELLASRYCRDGITSVAAAAVGQQPGPRPVVQPTVPMPAAVATVADGQEMVQPAADNPSYGVAVLQDVGGSGSHGQLAAGARVPAVAAPSEEKAAASAMQWQQPRPAQLVCMPVEAAAGGMAEPSELQVRPPASAASNGSWGMPLVQAGLWTENVEYMLSSCSTKDLDGSADIIDVLDAPHAPTAAAELVPAAAGSKGSAYAKARLPMQLEPLHGMDPRLGHGASSALSTAGLASATVTVTTDPINANSAVASSYAGNSQPVAPPRKVRGAEKSVTVEGSKEQRFSRSGVTRGGQSPTNDSAECGAEVTVQPAAAAAAASDVSAQVQAQQCGSSISALLSSGESGRGAAGASGSDGCIPAAEECYYSAVEYADVTCDGDRETTFAPAANASQQQSSLPAAIGLQNGVRDDAIHTVGRHVSSLSQASHAATNVCKEQQAAEAACQDAADHVIESNVYEAPPVDPSSCYDSLDRASSVTTAVIHRHQGLAVPSTNTWSRPLPVPTDGGPSSIILGAIGSHVPAVSGDDDAIYECLPDEKVTVPANGDDGKAGDGPSADRVKLRPLSTIATGALVVEATCNDEATTSTARNGIQQNGLLAKILGKNKKNTGYAPLQDDDYGT